MIIYENFFLNILYITIPKTKKKNKQKEKLYKKNIIKKVGGMRIKNIKNKGLKKK
jgi:hypothetical protein